VQLYTYILLIFIVIKTSLLMSNRCLLYHTKHINTLCGESAEFVILTLRWDIAVVCYKYHESEAKLQSEHN
jgi:hypothetical protein